jgi:hypothetical protein
MDNDILTNTTIDDVILEAVDNTKILSNLSKGITQFTKYRWNYLRSFY